MTDPYCGIEYNEAGYEVAVFVVPEWVLIATFRYALGRKSYIVNDTASLLIEYRNEIRPDWRKLIIKEIDDAIKSDCAGWECDIREWQWVQKMMREVNEESSTDRVYDKFGWVDSP